MMDKHYMNIAIELARVTQGQTTPNPVVGSVIVKNNQIVGMGAHLKAGEEHAERHALKMAGDKAKGATMYVTLEPCSHYGRTSPCADAVIEAGIKKVVVASLDLNPRVAGRGIQKLMDAGITVETGVMEKEAVKLNRVFFHYIKTKKPFVTLKTATSLDGKIATVSGESQWITGEEARLDVQHLRHTHDAILVGVNTVLLDNPSLTTRIGEGGSNPIRIVLDHQLRTPLDANIVIDKKSPTWIVTKRQTEKGKKLKLEELGVEIIEMDSDEIHISELLIMLGQREISSLLVEGGGTVNDAFLRSGDFQQVIVYLAPTIIGGKEALSSFSGLGIAKLKNTPKLNIESITTIGKDIKMILSKGD
ncbi:bifunctional diaminohydroxyphosphoribosylaminopyrimidine deaminase/5-amino-6-(5-phosphoribosylamino)uracil reductase RibD [Evansella tamaricis]|uniref:Riboflavin biosynthesis protein RibD n=1 Tax=Evansella tamaricis TaxID=2069301 RepID=A0ABS6JR47_9BACI|nr:bifunctional diaminohydroxyphosphoribosylaminopyrimidine deaminase/5-amino-6-(5-phosphoribosylamino)uracil reductase RibD [Evansella tamaricis]MBU9714773.1 bifunctional diaminohydroxyphosphoribosylaminopyrimidine deaminase/5-amino-6-(5-phosphoribosylamino)uracil reductase RibD [Evansella tamaricis]